MSSTTRVEYKLLAVQSFGDESNHFSEAPFEKERLILILSQPNNEVKEQYK